MKKISFPRKRSPLPALLVLLIIISAGAWFSRHTLARLVQQATLPEPIPYEEKTVPTPIPQPTKLRGASPLPIASPTAAIIPSGLPKEANLAVPFTSQAPDGNWDDPYGDFCEEASVLMAASYLTNKKIPNAAFANAALLAIRDFEVKRFGYHKDTNAEETATILREHFSYDNVELKGNPTAGDIKQALAEGRVVIAPVAGREIGNPYFQQPGPLYHMIVIKGYTADGKFITHDPGTRRGADFLYGENVIMEALHDWRTDGNIDLGKKVVIIAG